MRELRGACYVRHTLQWDVVVVLRRTCRSEPALLAAARLGSRGAISDLDLSTNGVEKPGI